MTIPRVEDGAGAARAGNEPGDAVGVLVSTGPAGACRKEAFGQLWGYRREGWARRFFENWRAALKWQRLKPYEKNGSSAGQPRPSCFTVPHRRHCTRRTASSK